MVRLVTDQAGTDRGKGMEEEGEETDREKGMEEEGEETDRGKGTVLEDMRGIEAGTETQTDRGRRGREEGSGRPNEAVAAGAAAATGIRSEIDRALCALISSVVAASGTAAGAAWRAFAWPLAPCLPSHACVFFGCALILLTDTYTTKKDNIHLASFFLAHSGSGFEPLSRPKLARHVFDK